MMRFVDVLSKKHGTSVAFFGKSSIKVVMKFHVITLFPEVIDSYTGASILGRAQREKILAVQSYQVARLRYQTSGVRPTSGRTAAARG